jgi:hypothetical protein
VRQNNRIAVLNPAFRITVVRGGCAPAAKLSGICGFEQDAAETAARWAEAIAHLDLTIHTLPGICRRLWRQIREFLLRREPPLPEAIARAAGVSTRTVGAAWRTIKAQLLAFWFTESDPPKNGAFRS